MLKFPLRSLLVAIVCFPLLSAYGESLFKEGVPSLDGMSLPLTTEMPHFPQLSKILSPSVVNIAVEASLGGDSKEDEADGEKLPDLPFFKKDQGIPMNSMGSGFVLHPDGYIVTNFHVVKDAKRVVVRLLDDKTEYEAKLVGADQLTDLALLKISAKSKLPAVYLGDSDQVEVGEWVLAIGNQFQLGQTVTAGIVSAKSRRVGGSPSRPYDQFIQTDAPINPGSSGGPLFNAQGQVIGINTAIFSPGRAPQLGGSGFNIGIGFSIPINLVKTVIPQLKDQGKVTRGLLGVLIQEVDADVAQVLGLSSAEGALVSDVRKDSPAEAAGFRRQDVIITFNGKKVKDHNELPLMVANTKIGSEAIVEVIRKGQTVVLKPVVGELKDEATARKKKAKPKFDALGLVVKHLTDEQARDLGIHIDSGVLVERVDENSVAERAKIFKGDVIQELGNMSTGSIDEFEKAVEALPKDTPALALLRRREGAFYVVVKLK